MTGRLRRLWCRWFGHDTPITFRPEGAFWCGSAGGYDCICLRCGARWEEYSEHGRAELEASGAKDPRLGNGS
jgi:hypothetical protein